MVSGIFKLAIAAITTILLLGLFFTYFMPFFLSEHNLIEAVKKQLSNAESAEGKYLSAEILFPPTFKLNALNLDTEIRSVAFSCNHSTVCCIKGNKCQQAIEWDERKIEMTKATKPKVSTRCKYENIFVCKVFFGEEPAQLAIEKIEFEETFDLGKKSEFDINIFVRNTGKKPLTNAKISADAYQKEEFKKETLIGKDENVIEQLAVNEVKKFELSIQNIKKNGEYVVKIVVEEIEDITDFERKEFSFNVIGAEAPLSGCKTTEKKTIYDIESEQCAEEYYCEGCKFAFQCTKEWKKQTTEELIEIDKKHAKLIIDESTCMLESDEELEYGTGFLIDNGMLTPITNIDSTGFEWSSPLDQDQMQQNSNGLLRWNAFNHPLDQTRYRSGMYPHRYLSIHRGMDIFAQGKSTPVRAIGDGTVFKISAFGPYVLHTLPNGQQVTSIYGHTEGIQSILGQEVKRGQVIAMLNCPTASSSPAIHGCHVHLEMYKGQITSAASSSKYTKGAEGSGGLQLLPNDQFLLNPIDIIGNYGH